MTPSELITPNMGLIIKIAKRYYRPNPRYTFDDLVQVGCLILSKQCEKYDPERGKVTTFIYMCASREMKKFVYRNRKRDEISFENLRITQDPDERVLSYNIREASYTHDYISHLPEPTDHLPRLSEEEVKILQMRVAGKSNKEIADACGCKEYQIPKKINRMKVRYAEK